MPRRFRTEDAIMGALIAIGLLGVYLAVGRHTFGAYDATVMVAVTENLVNHGTLHTTGALNDYLYLNTPYSVYGIGVSIISLPAHLLGKLTGHVNLLFSLVNPIVTALTGSVVYAIGRVMRWSRSLALLAALVFGTLTMALQASTELLSEPAVALCIAVMVLEVLLWRGGSRRAPLALGIAAAAAIQFRSDSLVTVWVALLALPLFVPWRTIRERHNLLMLGVPVAASLIGLFWYNWLRFGKLFEAGYEGNGFHNPLGRGVEGLLFSPGKSFFLYNPLAVLGVVGLLLLARRDRALAALFALLIVPRILFFAKWDVWYGGVTWGPRFLTPIVFIFVLGAVEILHVTTVQSSWRVSARLCFVVLVLASVPVSVLSVWVPYEQWRVTTANPAVPKKASEVAAEWNRVNFTFEGSQLRGDWWLLEQGKAETAPADFRGKDPQSGWGLLVFSTIGLVAAVVLSLHWDAAHRVRKNRGLALAPIRSPGG